MFLDKIIKVLCAVMFLGSVSVWAAKAPDFTLTDVDGKTVSLSDYKGKAVFLDFWASWCPPCRASIPEVEKLSKEMEGKNVVFLGINLESDPKATKKFAKSKGMTYRILMGNDQVSRDYSVSGIPAFVIIGPDGEIVERYVGFQPGMTEFWRNKINGSIKKEVKAPADKNIPSKKAMKK